MLYSGAKGTMTPNNRLQRPAGLIQFCFTSPY